MHNQLEELVSCKDNKIALTLATTTQSWVVQSFKISPFRLRAITPKQHESLQIVASTFSLMRQGGKSHQ